MDRTAEPPPIISFDDIKYGNPSLEDVNNMTVLTYLDGLLPSLCMRTPFVNSSVATREELNQLQEYSKNTEHSIRRREFDGALIPYIVDLFAKNGADAENVNKTCNELAEDLLPLITKLKYHFQRPRPYQLAYYYKLAFFPSFSKFVSSPSYPSGHTVLCAVIAEVLGTHYSLQYAGLYSVLQNFTGEVMESRLYMGVHYASDNRFALEVAQAVINNKEFRQKYEF